jgi:hypothetical protein
MKVTGDQKGVLALKKMYVKDREITMSYLKVAKKRNTVYFREFEDIKYVLYAITAEEGDIFKISKFQEGEIRLNRDGQNR